MKEIKYVLPNKSKICYYENIDNKYIQNYYAFILQQLILYCRKHDIRRFISLDVKNVDANILIGLHTEQSIYIKDDKISCVIFNRDHNADCNMIIDYSATNMHNIQLNYDDPEYIKKTTYFPPIIFRYTPIEINRINKAFVIHSSSPRRSKILKNIKVESVTEIFDRVGIRKEYDKFKVLVNIHQNENYRTLEEIRILPALVSGLLVISEDVPFRETVPYQKHVIWSSIDKLQETIDDVLNNYEDYRRTYLKDFDKTLTELYGIIESAFNIYLYEKTHTLPPHSNTHSNILR